jgi:hypothetical protein
MPNDLEVRLPIVPEGRVRMYGLRKPAVSESAVTSFARRVGLTGREADGQFARDKALLRYTEGRHVVQMHRASGGVRYYDTARWQVDDGESTVELTDRRATGLAEKYLDSVGFNDPNDRQLLRVTRLNVGAAELATGAREERVIDVGVCFQRMVDGIPVDGPGGKVAVYIDHSGEATGLERLWRPLGASSGAVEVRPPEWALDRIKRAYAEFDGRLRIDDFRFGYFGMDWDDSQDVLQPAYVVLLTITSVDPPLRVRKAEVLPAAVKPRRGLVPPRKKPVSQPPRG